MKSDNGVGDGIMKRKYYFQNTFLPIAVMTVSFMGVMVFTMLYMAKDNNYFNTIYRYFNISKKLHAWMMYTDIDKNTIVNGINICSVLFIASNHIFSRSFGNERTRIAKAVTRILAALFLTEILFYNTYVYRFLYYGRFGFLPDPALFRRLYYIFHQITMAGNFACLVYSMILLLRTASRNESIKELKYIKWCMILVNLGIVGLYYYMFYSLPDSFLWISRVTEYEIYNSMKMGKYFSMMKVIPYLIVLFILVLCYNVIKYENTVKRIENEEYVFSNIVASSEISTRSFSHYIKNELLGIVSEVEWIMKDVEGRKERLDSIKNSCMEMYSRLDELQKNSNRIVLNQSLCNFCEIVDEAVGNERLELEGKSIRLNYKSCEQKATVFADGRYLLQVLKNIFRNAIEAMEENGEYPKEITVMTRLLDNRVELVITDTGPGLDDRIQQHLFEPFVSTKSTKNNWGIGLSFCKRIINRHRGKIEAFNLPERGAGFRIELPLVLQEKG